MFFILKMLTLEIILIVMQFYNNKNIKIYCTEFFCLFLTNNIELYYIKYGKTYKQFLFARHIYSQYYIVNNI